MMKKANNNRPCLTARAFCWVPALLMTGMIAVLVLSLIGNQVLFSRTFYEKAALNPDVIEQEKAEVDQVIADLGRMYDFDPEILDGAPDRTDYEEMSRRMIDWWLRQNEQGGGEEAPMLNTAGIHDALEEEVEQEIGGIAAADLITTKISEAFDHSVFPIRTPLIAGLTKAAGKRVDLPQATGVVKQMPAPLAVAIVALAGLIALLTARRPKESLKYYGTAMGGSGFLLIAAWVLLRKVGLEGMVEEVSERLLPRFRILAGQVRLEILLPAAALLLLGGVLLGLYARNGKARKPEGTEA